VRRTQHEQRLALIASSATALTEQLTAFLAGEARPGVAAGRVPPGRRRRVVFVFPGQGPQWWPLGRELAAREPVFRETLAQCAAVLRAHVDWELEEVLKAETATSRLAETAVCQPVFCAVQIALAALWRAWRIEPAAVVGHSLGEVAAAYVAGALGLEGALRVAVQRGRLIQRVVGQGRMAMVELPAAEARRAIAAYEGRLAIAAVSGPRATVLSGEVAALEAVGAEQERAGVFFRV